MIPGVPNDYVTVPLPPSVNPALFAFTPDGSRLVVSEAGYLSGLRARQTVRMFGFIRRTEVEWREVWLSSCGPLDRSLIRFAADGNWFLAVEWRFDHRYPRNPRSPPKLVLYDFELNQQFDEADSPHPIHELEFCGKNLVYRSGVELYRRDASDVLDKFKPIRLEANEISTFASDPRGNFLLTASGNSVSVWDPKSWTVVKTYDWKAGAITCLAVAPDGLTAAAGTATGKVVVWDVE